MKFIIKTKAGVKVSTRADTWVKARVKAKLIVEVRLEMLLPFVRAFEIFSATLSLLVRARAGSGYLNLMSWLQK